MTGNVHPSDSAVTPDLRIVALDQLIEHEYNDVQRTAPLAMRISTEGLLKNPPIVTELDNGAERYVILDGANRYTALKGMGCPHILVQVVPYEMPYVTLSTWHHVITAMDMEEFTAGLDAVDGVEFIQVDLLAARAGLARREFLVYAIRGDGKVFAAHTAIPRRNIHETNRLLNACVDSYRNKGRLHRAVTDDTKEAFRMYPNFTGMVIFPKYDHSEVLILAREGELLPTGLTRHLIQGRALRVNFPISELKSYDPLDKKNQRLQEWMKHKMSSREVRFYGETTFLFDE